RPPCFSPPRQGRESCLRSECSNRPIARCRTWHPMDRCSSWACTMRSMRRSGVSRCRRDRRCSPGKAARRYGPCKAAPAPSPWYPRRTRRRSKRSSGRCRTTAHKAISPSKALARSSAAPGRRSRNPFRSLPRFCLEQILPYRDEHPLRGFDLGGAQPPNGVAVRRLGERDQPSLQPPALSREMDVDRLAVPRDLGALHVAELFHRLDGGVRRGLHDAGFVGELALGKAVARPQNPQECPVAEAPAVRREPGLQVADEGAPGFLRQVGKPVWLRNAISLPSREERRMARHASSVAAPQSPSCRGGLPSTSA